MMKPTILLIGLGDLGSITLEYLAREEGIGRIVVGGRNVERTTARCNLARISAIAHGYNPTIVFRKIDLSKKETVIKTIQDENPDIIYCTATMLTWWLPQLLPSSEAEKLKKIPFGAWLPVHLTPTIQLMEAVSEVSYKGLTLTAPFPDVVNNILKRLNLAPACGVGNIDELVPKIRYLTAQRLNVALEQVHVTMVGHHALESAIFAQQVENLPPYFLRIQVNGEDVTDAVNAHELMISPYPITSGKAIHFLTAGSTVRIIRALISEKEYFIHAPAPNGLPGGYPIVASKEGVKPVKMPELSLDQAIQINEASHPFDGIQKIEENGTVVFAEGSMDIMKETLGYTCQRLHPTESEQYAQELVARFKEYAKRYGVRIDG